MKGNSLKLITLLMVLFLFITSAVGCSAESENNTSTSFKEISDEIIKSADLSSMMEGDSRKLQQLYEIDEDKLENYVIYTPSANIQADELLLLQVKDPKDLSDIEDKIKKRIESKKAVFKDYLPEEYNLMENSVLETKENYIFYLASKNADKVRDVFMEFFK